jgi:thioredoxin reductase (NADPH)
MDIRLDAFIVGAGPIGLACGIEAERRGMSYVIADKGCLVNSLYNYPYNMTFFSTSDRLEIGGVPLYHTETSPIALRRSSTIGGWPQAGN